MIFLQKKIIILNIKRKDLKIKLLIITVLISNYTIVLATPNIDLINNLDNSSKNKN